MIQPLVPLSLFYFSPYHLQHMILYCVCIDLWKLELEGIGMQTPWQQGLVSLAYYYIPSASPCRYQKIHVE